MNRKFIYIGCTVFAMSLFHAGGIQAQEENKDSLVNVAFGTVAQEDLTHAISTVNTSELTKKVNSSSSLVGLESLIGGCYRWSAHGRSWCYRYAGRRNRFWFRSGNHDVQLRRCLGQCEEIHRSRSPGRQRL